MTNFHLSLDKQTDEELKQGINTHNPHFAQLESEELTRRTLRNLEKTIKTSTNQSRKLEEANYTLQKIMTVLVAVSTLIATFPIVKAFFTWMAPVISGVVSEPVASDVSINSISAFVAIMVAFIIENFLKRPQKIKIKIKSSD